MIFYRAIKPIKALSFDLDDTLYDNHPHMLTSEQALIDFLHTEYPSTQAINKGKWRSIKAEILSASPALKSDMGELRYRVLQHGLKHAGYQGLALSNAVSRCFDYFYFQRSNFTVDKNIRSLLAELAEKLPLVAITNGNVNLQQIGIAEYFEHTLKASLSLPMKPDPLMFVTAAQQLDIDRQHIMHVGDNFEKDVMGAIAAGCQSAWYAWDQERQLANERISVLPHISLKRLSDLKLLVF